MTEPEGGSDDRAMEATRPGDVLAGRYRLADLLSEARGGTFWLAQDEVLGRPVALHVISSGDDRAALLLDAAKESASVTDQRLLRVLDAARLEETVYVVNEWGVGTSTDHLLGERGPVSPRRAAWITAEVADCLATGHAAGHAHGRLNPENVLLDELGGVHVIGYAVDAALHGLRRSGSVAVDTDLLDLGGLLQALLTGRWAGVSDSHVPPVPRSHGRPLRPRQVRAGVPRVLDDLCGTILTASPAARPSASQIATALREYVGDPSDLASEPLEASVSGSGRQPITPAFPIPITMPAGPAVDAGNPGTEPGPDARQGADTTTTPDATGDEGPPTEASEPVFDDTLDTPRAGRRPTSPSPPPPSTAPPPAKPLFTDEPRRPRYDEEPVEAERTDSWLFSSVPPSVVVSSEPWEDDDVPGRSWLRLALGLALGIGIVVVAVVLYRWLGDSSGGGATDVPPSQQSSHVAEVAVAVPHLGVRSYDPQGTGEEYPELAPYAVDGKVATTWHTSTYFQQFGPGGLKDGVGLVLALHRRYDVTKVTVDVVGQTSLSVYVSETAPGRFTAPSGKPAAKASGEGTLTLPVHTVRGRYVVVWLTSLPHDAAGYVGTIAEVGVTGIPVT